MALRLVQLIVPVLSGRTLGRIAFEASARTRLSTLLRKFGNVFSPHATRRSGGLIQLFLRSPLARLALRNDKYIGGSDPRNTEMATFDLDVRRLLAQVVLSDQP